MNCYEIVVGIIAWFGSLLLYGYMCDCYVKDRYGYSKFKKDKPHKESILFRLKQFFELKLYRKYFWWIFRK